MISIIIPVYNHGPELAQCLESIKSQTYDNYEIIIVNDRSTERMYSLIEPYIRHFSYSMRVYNNQSRHGASYSRNKGLKHVKGEYVIFIDADMVLEPKMLDVMYSALQARKEASFAYCAHRFGSKTFRFWDFDAAKLKEQPFMHTSALIRREHIPESGWDESLKRLQDWDFYLTMAEQGRSGIYIDEVLFTIKPGGTMSTWTPKFLVKHFRFLPRVKRYNEAVEIVKKKHGI